MKMKLFKIKLKKILLKFLKISSVILLLFVLVITSAVLWPMPKLDPPKKFDTVFIKSANIIDVKSGDILENRDILIKNNIISAIDTSGILKANANSLIIDGSGKYIIPGLWDMHTHSNQHSEWLHHPLYIANGVTGIRDMAGQLNKKDSYFVGSQERLGWNAELNQNKIITPRYVLQSSYPTRGSAFIPEGFPDFFKLEKDEHIGSFLSFYKNEQIDFIKIYTETTPQAHKKLALEASKYGIHLAGHKPLSVSLEDAITNGQRSFEHGRIFLLESFPGAENLRTSDNWKEFFKKSIKSIIEDFNPETASKLMMLMKENNTYWTPTLQVHKFEAFAHKSTFTENPNLKYTTSVGNYMWGMEVSAVKKYNLSTKGKDVTIDFYNAVKEQVKMAKQIGVPIMAGTDVADAYCFAGFSMHDELEDLTKSGLTNLVALQSATIIPAEFAKKDNDYGTIETNKIADLIILDKNRVCNLNSVRFTFHPFQNLSDLLSDGFWNAPPRQRHPLWAPFSDRTVYGPQI